MKIMGIDPGIASMGVAVADVLARRATFIDVAVLTTSKDADEVGSTADLARRARYLYRELRAFARVHSVDRLCVEAVAFPRGRVQWTVMSMLGRARGLVDALAEELSIPVCEYQPQQLKLAVTGNRKAEKHDVALAILETHPELARVFPTQTGLHQHAADACATVECWAQGKR